MRPDLALPAEGPLIEDLAMFALRDRVRHTLELLEQAAEAPADQRYCLLVAVGRSLRAATGLSASLARVTRPAPVRRTVPSPHGHAQGGEWISQTGPLGPEVGALLVVARERAGLTELEAAKSAGMRPADYCTFEAGQRRVQLKTAVRIAQLPWVGTVAGSAMVRAVQADIDRRTAEQAARAEGA